MQEPEQTAGPQQGPALRRGKQLAPIQTTFPSDPLPKIQRPPPIETIIYNTSPDEVRLTEEPKNSVTTHRTSKSILGLFQRNKSTRDVGSDDCHGFFAKESSERSGADSSASTTPRVKSRTKKPKSPALKKEKAARSLMAWDPPPLFQAYPQAVKHSTLPAPTLDADTILKIDNNLRAGEKRPGVHSPGARGDKGQTRDRADRDGKKKHKHHQLGSLNLEWTTKTHVLTTTGALLQYSSSGHPDRLPERILQLGKDSAAFASDVLPGKHWVLQVCQTTEDNCASANTPRSVLSRLGLRTSYKRAVANFLMVMENAEEMDSWLVAVRKEIQGLGGKSYQPELITRISTDEVMRQLQEKPSRRFLIKRNPDQPMDVEGDAPAAPSEVTESSASDSAGDQPTPRAMPDRPLLELRSFSGASTGTRTSMNADVPKSDRNYGNRQSAFGRPIPYETVEKTSTLIRSTSAALKPAGDRSSVPTREQNASSSMAVEPMDAKIADDRIANTPQASVSSRPQSSQRPSSNYSDSPPPNFSVPIFSSRFSQAEKTNSTTPPTSASSTSRTASVSDSGRKDARPESIVGELPTSIRSSPKSAHRRSKSGQTPTLEDPGTVREFEGGFESKASNLDTTQRLSYVEPPQAAIPLSGQSQTVLVSRSSSSLETQSPRRFSSVDYSVKATRSSRQRFEPSPYSPPTAALPAPPTQARTPTPPKPSQATAQPIPVEPKLRRPASMQVRSSVPTKMAGRTSLSTLRQGTANHIPDAGDGLYSFQPRTSLHGPPVLPPPRNPLPELPLAAKGGEYNANLWSASLRNGASVVS